MQQGECIQLCISDHYSNNHIYSWHCIRQSPLPPRNLTKRQAKNNSQDYSIYLLPATPFYVSGACLFRHFRNFPWLCIRNIIHAVISHEQQTTQQNVTICFEIRSFLCASASCISFKIIYSIHLCAVFISFQPPHAPSTNDTRRILITRFFGQSNSRSRALCLGSLYLSHM